MFLLRTCQSTVLLAYTLQLKLLDNDVPAFTSIQCYDVNTKALYGPFFSYLPHKSPVENNNTGGESESQAATEHSSVASSVSVKGSFALDGSLSLSSHHLNIHLLP